MISNCLFPVFGKLHPCRWLYDKVTEVVKDTIHTLCSNASPRAQRTGGNATLRRIMQGSGCGHTHIGDY